MRDSSMPSSVTPRGFIEAASTALPVRVRLTSSQSRPIASQQTAAVKNSFVGVRTPRMLTTPSTIGSTVFGVVGEEVGDEFLDHDAPEQRRGQDEDLLLLGDAPASAGSAAR